MPLTNEEELNLQVGYRVVHLLLDQGAGHAEMVIGRVQLISFMVKFKLSPGKEYDDLLYYVSTHLAVMCLKRKLGITVTVTIWSASSMILAISLSFTPTTFWPFTCLQWNEMEGGRKQ